MLGELHALQPPRRPTVRKAYDEAMRYFENHHERMNYPYYRAQGWQIGSGPVESACKTVVGQRLKQAGMRWKAYGTDSVCHLRACFAAARSIGRPSGNAA